MVVRMRLGRVPHLVLATATLVAVLLGQRGWAIASVGPVRERAACRCCPRHEAAPQPSITARCCTIDAPAPGARPAPPAVIAAMPMVVAPSAVIAVAPPVRARVAAPAPLIEVRAIGPPAWLRHGALRL